jgi:hypothetical protein
VDLRGQAVLRIDPGLAGDPVWLRLTLLDRLVTAQTLLPARVKHLVRQGYQAADPAHAAGAAVDLGLCTSDGRLVDLGNDELAGASRRVGLVNHPTGSRHWSYGDSYQRTRPGPPPPAMAVSGLTPDLLGIYFGRQMVGPFSPIALQSREQMTAP